MNLADDDRRALSLAAAALNCGLADDWAAARDLVQQLNDECGGAGMSLSIRTWCDTYLVKRFGPTGKPAEPVHLQFGHAKEADFTTVTAVASADGVPAEVAWAGQLLSARASHDKGTYCALMNAVANDAPDAVGRHVMGLLRVVALNIRALARAEQ